MSVHAISHVPSPLEQAGWTRVRTRVIGQLAISRPRLLTLSFIAGILILAAYVYLPSFYVVETDDAFVQADTVSVVPKVTSYVTKLHVEDNSTFKTGDLLAELDSREFLAAIEVARSDIDAARAAIANIAAQLGEQVHIVEAFRAAVDGDRGSLDFANQQLTRYGSLARNGYGSTERWQQAQSENSQRSSALAHDLASLAAAQAHAQVLETQRSQLEASLRKQEAILDRARTDLSYTTIYAPLDGSVANKTVQVGNLVQPGQALFSAVPEQVYVVANFKETQLASLSSAKTVDIFVDALPGKHLHGHVDSLQRGTGSSFALLPPENATGNFVKVVQRVPVKIIIDDLPTGAVMVSPGMSAMISVIIRPLPRYISWLVGRW